jgi:hypothetical protein
VGINGSPCLTLTDARFLSEDVNLRVVSIENTYHVLPDNLMGEEGGGAQNLCR